MLKTLLLMNPVPQDTIILTCARLHMLTAGDLTTSNLKPAHPSLGTWRGSVCFARLAPKPKHEVLYKLPKSPSFTESIKTNKQQ